jgi:transcription antitermination factor NusG
VDQDVAQIPKLDSKIREASSSLSGFEAGFSVNRCSSECKPRYADSEHSTLQPRASACKRIRATSRVWCLIIEIPVRWLERVSLTSGFAAVHATSRLVKTAIAKWKRRSLSEMLETQSAHVPSHQVSESPLNWYAVHTRPSRERRTAEHFSYQGLENFLPHYRVVRRWKNRCTKISDIPLFPGYLFVRIAPVERIRVLEVPSVISIVGRGREPLPLPDPEAEPHPHLTVGQRARIRGGALAGMEGVVVRKSNSVRVVLTLDLIMQSVSVEVDGDELEPIYSVTAANRT